MPKVRCKNFSSALLCIDKGMCIGKVGQLIEYEKINPSSLTFLISKIILVNFVSPRLEAFCINPWKEPLPPPSCACVSEGDERACLSCGKSMLMSLFAIAFARLCSRKLKGTSYLMVCITWTQAFAAHHLQLTVHALPSFPGPG